MKRCNYTNCGSYAFNLYKQGINQGTLCDVHYFMAERDQLKAINKDLLAALEECCGIGGYEPNTYAAMAIHHARAAIKQAKGENHE